MIDDLVDLVLIHFEEVGVDPAAHAEFTAAIEREPRLLLRFMGLSRERDRQAVALVAQREAVPADDARAEATITILSTLIRSAGDKYVDPTNSREFSTILRDDLAALRTVLTPTAARKA